MPAESPANTADRPSRLRKLLGSLQLPVAGAGVLGFLLFATAFASLFGSTPEGDGFVHGGALLFSYVLMVGGYTVFAIGLAIPPGPGVGIQFRRPQRALFLVAAVSAVASVVLPLLLLPSTLGGNANPVFYAWFATTALAVGGVAGGLVWRGGEWITARRSR